MLCEDAPEMKGKLNNEDQRNSRITFLILCSLAFITFAGEVTQARSLSKRIVAPEVSFEEIFAAERRLSELGYWTGPVDGTLDSGSRHALIAFRKMEGRQRTGKLTSAELQALLSAIRPLPKFRLEQKPHDAHRSRREAIGIGDDRWS